ncbi:MAG TPA: hypothetical protein VJB37_01270 [Patescibacteria group bacterium]|nr:hypothetical protein [Patescibacteria group bacterium]
MAYNLLKEKDWQSLRDKEPERFNHNIAGGSYLRLWGADLADFPGLELDKLEQAARLMRGLMFAALEASRSGHPGGASSKTEQFLSLVLGGAMVFDYQDPKHPGRDRMVWSAGHCSAGLYGGMSLFYECLQRAGKKVDYKKYNIVKPADLPFFRKWDGPQGHIENYYPFSDLATGPSGHGFPGAGGMGIVHRSCGLDTKIWVLMGDAESEEGMTYEARNILNTVGADNVIVSLDYNNYGIDGDIKEVILTPYINHWLGLGWNVIEIDGHNFKECTYAYHLAAKKVFANGSPTVILARTIKGKKYGSMENTATSHGTPAKHEEYLSLMKELGFDIPGQEGKVGEDVKAILTQLTPDLVEYIADRLETVRKGMKTEESLVEQMRQALPGRPLVNPLSIRRPEVLPEELSFTAGNKVATRKATQAFFEWLMKQTAFFWAGTGDLSKSILVDKAEKVYGLIDRNNPLGRGLRFGIAEQNMAMMSTALTADRLPGGFAPVSVFSSYAVFTSMMSNAVRLALIGNHLNPANKGFFIMLAAHDGPETGEDGPTHQGLYWLSLFTAYPGIKVFKPMDANETIEMLFYALEKGEPIALSVSRPDTPVFERGNGVPEAREAINGAYVYRAHEDNGKKKVVLAISGGTLLANTLAVLPDLLVNLDVKIVAVTSPQLFEDLRRQDPKKAQAIFADEERERTIILHAGWKGFLYPFLLPAKYEDRNIAIETYLKSDTADGVYVHAGLVGEKLLDKVIKASKNV